MPSAKTRAERSVFIRENVRLSATRYSRQKKIRRSPLATRPARSLAATDAAEEKLGEPVSRLDWAAEAVMASSI